MEGASNVNFRINDDAQLVVTETDPLGRVRSEPIILSRDMSLVLACETITNRIVDGTINQRLTLRTFLMTMECLGSTWEQGDRVLIERYVDNDTGET